MKRLLLTLAGVAGLSIFSSLGCKDYHVQDYYGQQATAENLPADTLSFEYGKKMNASGNKIDSVQSGRSYTNYNIERSLEKSPISHNNDVVYVHRGKKTIYYLDRDADGRVDLVKITENHNAQEYEIGTPGTEPVFTEADKYLADTKLRFKDWSNEMLLKSGLNSLIEK